MLRKKSGCDMLLLILRLLSFEPTSSLFRTFLASEVCGGQGSERQSELNFSSVSPSSGFRLESEGCSSKDDGWFTTGVFISGELIGSIPFSDNGPLRMSRRIGGARVFGEAFIEE